MLGKKEDDVRCKHTVPSKAERAFGSGSHTMAQIRRRVAGLKARCVKEQGCAPYPSRCHRSNPLAHHGAPSHTTITSISPHHSTVSIYALCRAFSGDSSPTFDATVDALYDGVLSPDALVSAGNTNHPTSGRSMSPSDPPSPRLPWLPLFPCTGRDAAYARPPQPLPTALPRRRTESCRAVVALAQAGLLQVKAAADGLLNRATSPRVTPAVLQRMVGAIADLSVLHAATSAPHGAPFAPIWGADATPAHPFVVLVRVNFVGTSSFWGDFMFFSSH